MSRRVYLTEKIHCVTKVVISWRSLVLIFSFFVFVFSFSCIFLFRTFFFAIRIYYISLMRPRWRKQDCAVVTCWKWHWYRFLTLEFPPSSVTQFCRISRGDSLFSKDKVTNLKVRVFRNVYIISSNHPLLGFFL